VAVGWVGKWGGALGAGKVGQKVTALQNRFGLGFAQFSTVFPLKIGLELQLDRKPKTFCTLDDAKQFVINQCLEFSCFSTWLRFRPLPFANNQSSWKSEDNTKK